MNNTKKLNINKKIVAILLILFMLLSNISPIFAASGSGTWVAAQWASYIHTTDNANTQYGVLLRRLTNVNTGETKTVFCSQHGVDIATGVREAGNYYTPTSAKVKKACKIAYFGWYSKYGDYIIDGGTSAERKLQYVLVQQFIWETLGQSSATFIDSSHQSQYVALKNTINSQINSMSARPSFDATTIELDAGDSYTATDTKGILANYNSIDKTLNGVRFQHTKGENTLKITVSENCEVENLKVSDATTLAWGLIKAGTEDKDTTIYFQFADDVQDQIYALNYDDPVTLAFSLKINLLGNLELDKLNTNGDLVDGSVFTVNGPGYNGDVTVKNGKITLEKIKKGTYTIKEKSVGTGYLLNTQTYSAVVKPNQTTTQAIVNSEPTGELTLTKIDIDTGNTNRIDGTIHHGDASIKGAVYTLYASSDIYNVAKTIKYFSKDEEIATFTFNEHGVATVKVTNSTTPAKINVNKSTLTGLPMGSYYSKESIVPNGYTKDTNTYTYNLSYKDYSTKVITETGIVKNTVQKAPFEVIKVSTNNNTTADVIEGAEFTAILTKYVDFYGSFDEALKHIDQYADDEYSVFTTSSNGHGVSGLLAYGNYTVNETFTPSAEIEPVEEFYVTIDKDSKTPIKELVENDLPFESYIKLVKQDKKTGKIVTLSNATFELYKLNEETNQWEQIRCKVRNKYYTSWTTDKNGAAYTETKLEAGKYKVSEISIPRGFIGLDEELTFEINRKNKTLEYDADWDAWITVTVKNEQPVGILNVTKAINLRDNVNTTLIKDIDYTKISFELVANENIIDYSDGSTIYEKGTVIGTYKLSSDAKLSVKNLPMGAYYLKEVSTIDGAVLSDTKYDVVFRQQDTTTKEYILDMNIENETTAIEFSKTSITGDEELEGAKLTVLDKNGKIIDSWTSTKETHKIEGLTAGNSYILKEEIAPDSFVKATDIEFTVENTNEIQKVTMIDKIVEMSKVNIGGEEIEGATIQVFDKDNNIVDEWVSSKEPHKINGLIEGQDYVLHEEIVAKDYVKATDVEFTVSYDKQTQKVEMIDKVVDVTKTDLTNGEEIEGAELVITDKEGNIIDEWISSKEPHHVNNLEEGKDYILTEKTAPYGFEVAESIEFTVSYDKETQLIEMKDMPILKSVQVEKVDKATGEHIKSNKFEFGIYEDAECTKLIKRVGANEFEGTALFDDLRYGTFYIKEDKAPLGYKLSDQIVKIEINDEGVFADGISLEEKDGIYSFVYYNSLLPIIQTGNETNYILISSLAAISLIGIVTGIVILKKKRNN